MTTWIFTRWARRKWLFTLSFPTMITRSCARIGHLAMQKNGTAPHDNAGGRLPDRKAKADTGTQHGRKAVSCPKAIGHD